MPARPNTAARWLGRINLELEVASIEDADRLAADLAEALAALCDERRGVELYMVSSSADEVVPTSG